MLDPLRRSEQAGLLAVPGRINDAPLGAPSASHELAEDARFFEMGALPQDLGFLNNRRLLETLARRLSGGGRS